MGTDPKAFRRTAVLAAMLVAMAAIAPASASAAVSAAGDLIKLPDDGNPNTSHDTAVYYHGSDGRRYVFPNSRTYLTWYGDFSGVRTVDAAWMSSLTIGGNVTYRPGVRLVKVVSDPKTYVVDANGTLRPIASESVAVGLYGRDWNRMVDDLPEAFFVSYRIGPPVSSVSDFFPSGATAAAVSIGVDRGLTASEQPVSGETAGPVLPPVTAGRVKVVAYRGMGKETVVRGAQGVTVSGVSFEATSETANTIRSVSFQGYIDEEATNGFLPGEDNDNGTVTHIGQLVERAYLFDASGQMLAGPVEVDGNGRVVFGDLSRRLAAGTVANLLVRADLSPTANIEGRPDRIVFDIVDASRDVTVVDDWGRAVGADGRNPLGGTDPSIYLTVAAKGKLSVNWVGGSGAVVAGRDFTVGELALTPEYDTYSLKVLAFRVEGGPLETLPGPLRLTVTGSSGAETVAVAEIIGNRAVFGKLDIPVDRSFKMQLSGRLASRDGGALYGERIRISLDADTGLNFVSLSDGSPFSYRDMDGTNFRISGNRMSDWDVRYSGLAVALSPDLPTAVGRGNPVGVLGFSVRAEPEGAVRVRKLRFRIRPGDAGANDNGTNISDMLEVLGRAYGGIGDDDGLTELEWVGSSGNRQLIGEGQDGAVSYTGYLRNGSAVTDYGSYVSAVGDYAVIDYVLSEGQEWTVPSGTTHVFGLGIDLSGFWVRDRGSLSVELVGGGDFLWTDTASGPYTALSGTAVAGFPISKSVTVY